MSKEHTTSGQGELFPDQIRDQPYRKHTEFPLNRGESRGYTKKPRYHIVTVPDWIKEGRNRDTKSNLDWK